MEYNFMYTLNKKRIIRFTQISLAIIYITFGALKVFGGSPADDLILTSITFLDFNRFYPTLGIAEVVIGFSFLYRGWFKKVGFRLFLGHMIGTFLPFITVPELCVGTCTIGESSHPTFTIVGQYIVKNLALIGCGLVLKFSKKDNI